jgi:hypothetical protein
MRSTLKKQLLSRTAQLSAAREALWTLRGFADAAIACSDLTVDAGAVLATTTAGLSASDPHVDISPAAQLGALGGRASSVAKRLAVQRNGKRGGRPRELLPCIHCETETRDRDASRRARLRGMCSVKLSHYRSAEGGDNNEDK